MKIGINGYEAVVPRFGYNSVTGLPNRVGSGEVCFQWLKELSKIDKKNEYKIFLPTLPTEDMPEETERFRYEIIKAKRLWTLIGLSKRLLKEKDLDVFFTPTHYSPFFTSCPQVISILDVSYKKFPDLFTKFDLYQLALWGRLSVKKASKIITISRSSKDDIIQEYGVKSSKVAVAHLGIKPSLKLSMTDKDLIQKYSITSPYILFVGTIQPRKNVLRLIQAFSKLAEKHPNLKLVIVGKKGWQYEEILREPEKLGISEKVIFLHNVTDEDLAAFYKFAEAFVLPSLYEGFGLPILEAMKYECPVITSNTSSLPEAGGEAALYVNPENVAEIASKIEKVLTDNKLKEHMIAKGKEQVKKFSWEKSAREVLQILEEVGGKNV